MSDRLVVDTSAIASIDLFETEGAWFAEAIARADDAVMSAGTLQELALVLGRRNRQAVPEPVGAAIEIANEVRYYGIKVIPVDEELAMLGAAASVRFSRKPARLNYGDGFAYALAKRLDAPILCKGDDFVNTDVQVLQPPRD